MKKTFNLSGMKDWVVYHIANGSEESRFLSRKDDLFIDWSSEILELFKKSALNFGWVIYAGVAPNANFSTGPILDLSSTDAKDAVNQINEIVGSRYFDTYVSDIPSHASDENSVIIASIPVHKKAILAKALTENGEELQQICSPIVGFMSSELSQSNELDVS